MRVERLNERTERVIELSLSEQMVLRGRIVSD